MFVEIFNDIGEEEIDVGEGWVYLGVVWEILFEELHFEDDFLLVSDLVLGFDVYLIIVLDKVKVHKSVQISERFIVDYYSPY
jgi:hypothetical protein